MQTGSLDWKEYKMPYDYIEQDSLNKVRFRRVVIFLLAIAIIASAAAAIFLLAQQKTKQDTIAAYDQAIIDGDYASAMNTYRQVKEKALSNDISEKQQILYKQTLESIENDIELRLDNLFNDLLAGRKADSDELKYAEGMAEIAGVRLVDFVRNQCQLFLLGEINSDELMTRTESLLELENVKPVLFDIPEQIPAMRTAVPEVVSAQSALDLEDWPTAYSAWTGLLEKEEYGPFVIEFAYERLELTKAGMYEPLLSEAESLISGGRYVSAHENLEYLLGIFPEDKKLTQLADLTSEFVPDDLTRWTEIDLVEILTIRPLIIDEQEAFDNDEYAPAANDVMMTAKEFKDMINQLYLNDFVLIDAFRLYGENGSYNEFMVPAGKKPLVLVFDSMNYYVTRRETGNAWNLVLDNDGNVCAEYPAQNGDMIVDREAEAIGILDVFVEQNPDFSYDGAKGVISLTGYECIFGYTVNEEQAEIRNSALVEHGYSQIDFSQSELASQTGQATSVINRLKETGWLFASSTYGNINLRDSSLDTLRQDTEKWLSQIGSLTGEVELLNYPLGAFLSGSDQKLEYLVGSGFYFLAGQGTTPYRIYQAGYLYADRLPINGFTLRQSGQYQLDRLFDVSKVYDELKRP